jgi:integrase
MKNRFRLIKRGLRNCIFYAFDTQTGKRTSLHTQDAAEAARLLNAKNEGLKQPALNLQLARVYMQHSDPGAAERKWQHVMDQMGKCKKGSTRERWDRGVAQNAFDLVRNLALAQTRAEDFIAVLTSGTVSTNLFLRRMHNFAIDMNWLLAPVIPRRQWPKITFKERRGITLDEHQRILASEKNPEWRAYYELLWHLGGAQTDTASLKAEDVNWDQETISYRRGKSKTPVLIHFGKTVADLLRSLPEQGPLFPMLGLWEEKNRGKAFIRRCRLAKVTGVSLHSYRYAWAERAKTAGMPERFAQEALGHNSKAVHRAYSRKALVKVPSLEEYESKIVPMPKAKTA